MIHIFTFSFLALCSSSTIALPQVFGSEYEKGRSYLEYTGSTGYLCGTYDNPVGVCTLASKCTKKTGGIILSYTPGCNQHYHICCQYAAIGSRKTSVGASVFYWMSVGYPATTATGPALCELIVKPQRDTCFIRVQFEDTILTAPIEEYCNGNSLTIYHQAEGDGSLICGALNNYETLVKPRDLQPIKFILTIRDVFYKYKIKISQIKCSQVNGIVPSSRSLNARDLDFDNLFHTFKVQENKTHSTYSIDFPDIDNDVLFTKANYKLLSRDEEFVNDNSKFNKKLAADDSITLEDMAIFAKKSNLLAANDTIKTADLSELCSDIKRQAKIEGRIYDPGTSEEVDNAPYLGSMMIRSAAGQFKFCGATLIHRKYAITIASCALRGGYDTDGYEVRVYFTGEAEIADDDSFEILWNGEGMVKVDKVIFHPMYDHRRFHYDIAVLKLSTAVSGITPIKLPQPGQQYEGKEVSEMGFGLDSLYNYLDSADLEEAAYYENGDIISNADCQTAYRSAPNFYAPFSGDLITDELFCVKLYRESQFCRFDEGTPVVSGYDTDDAVLLGILIGNFHDCIHTLNRPDIEIGKYPDISLRITSVLDFINAATTNFQYPIDYQMLSFPSISIFNPAVSNLFPFKLFG